MHHTITEYSQALNDGVRFLQTMPANTDLRDLGFDAATARYFTITHDMLFGPTSHTRYQRAVLKSALKHCHSVAVLHAIAQCTARLKDITQRWQVRKELAALKLTPRAMRVLANQRVRQLQPKVRTEGVVYSIYEDGKASMRVTADATTIADLRGHIRELDDVKKLFGEGGGLEPVKGYPQILIHLDDAVKILDGDGRDVKLRMTNGAVITGAELFDRALKNYMGGVLFHPVEGPVNAYRSTRDINAAQRMIVHAENPECVWKGCRIPANECQVHHIEAWSEGGDTNLSNLATLCKYHNGVNDDARIGTRRGHVERRNGSVQWTRATKRKPTERE